MTRALAELFGEVHGVDISGEMIAQASMALDGCSNVHLHQGSGEGLEFSAPPSLISFCPRLFSSTFLENPSSKIMCAKRIACFVRARSSSVSSKGTRSRTHYRHVARCKSEL